MQALLELAPLVAFFVAYYFGGIYVATGVLMAGMAVLLAVDYLLHRRISPMHALSAVLVFALGAATLLLHDKHFIQLKPTALFWFASLAFLASFWFGKQTFTERLFTAALQGQVKVPESLWRRMNALWVVFYGLLGGANLVIAKYASERVWVYSKIGLTVLTFIFAVAQVLYLVKRGEPTPQPAERPASDSQTPTPVQEPPAV
jgi:intracellular septation protein